MVRIFMALAPLCSRGLPAPDRCGGSLTEERGPRQTLRRRTETGRSAPGQLRPQRLVVAEEFLAGVRGGWFLPDLAQGDAVVAGLAHQAEQLAVRVDAEPVLVQLVDVAGAEPRPQHV